MKKQILSIFLVLCIMGSISGAFGADFTLNSMDESKSVNNQGVMNITYDNGTKANAICIDKNQTIYLGSTNPYLEGTNSVPNNLQIKQLIVDNYRSDMTKKQGQDLQFAIWYFTGDVSYNSLTVDQTIMVDLVLSNPKIYADKDVQIVLNNETILLNTATETITKLVSSDTTTSTVVSSNGNSTNVVKEITENGYKLITTFVEYFVEETTFETVNVFMTTITTTDTYQWTAQVLTFNFNQFISGQQQDLMLFSAIESTITGQFTETSIEEQPFSETEKQSQNRSFNKTTITEENFVDPQDPVDNTTTKVVGPKTVPMQETGAPIGLLVLAILAIFAGYKVRK